MRHRTIDADALRAASACTRPTRRPAIDNEHMIGDRWGVTDGEISRSYPCDAFVVSPVLQAWRGVRVEAPAGAVWPVLYERR
jgi:hypothetical protein